MSMPAKDHLRILTGEDAAQIQKTIISDVVRNHFNNVQRQLYILDAGCGTRWSLNLSGLNYKLTGIDISKEAIDLRISQRNDLDKAIVGDLQSIDMNSSEFDLIFCQYVLEHVSGAELVLNKFFDWLKPNGLLILIIPDRNTFKGLATRLAPFWIHECYVRYVRKAPVDHGPGHHPYPTYFDKILTTRKIRDYCRCNGYTIHTELGRSISFKDRPVFNWLCRMAAKIVEVATFRYIAADHCDLVYIIENSNKTEMK